MTTSHQPIITQGLRTQEAAFLARGPHSNFPALPLPSLFFIDLFSLLVDGGHRAVKYSRVFGVQKEVYNEGTHFVIPWFETPIIYDVRAKPRNVASLTGTKGMFRKANCYGSHQRHRKGNNFRATQRTE